MKAIIIIAVLLIIYVLIARGGSNLNRMSEEQERIYREAAEKDEDF